MTWDYRVIERDVTDGREGCFAIHEVYYDGADKVTHWTESPVGGVVKSLEDLAQDIETMQRAFGKPVLKESELLRGLAERGKE